MCPSKTSSLSAATIVNALGNRGKWPLKNQDKILTFMGCLLEKGLKLETSEPGELIRPVTSAQSAVDLLQQGKKVAVLPESTTIEDVFSYSFGTDCRDEGLYYTNRIFGSTLVRLEDV